jgi:hypothetical protein
LRFVATEKPKKRVTTMLLKSPTKLLSVEARYKERAASDYTHSPFTIKFQVLPFNVFVSVLKHPGQAEICLKAPGYR